MSEIPNRSGVVILLAHPNERSLNHAIAARAAEAARHAGVEATLHDLYAEGFDPVLPKDEMLRKFSFDETVQQHITEIKRTALLVVVHPDWWGQPPAILKGWLDRVLRPGVGYDFQGGEFDEKRPVPLLTGLRGLVFTTSDEPAGARPMPIEHIWRDTVFGFCGIGPGEVTLFPDVRRASRRTRRGWLEQTARAVRQFALPSE
ncbi:MAG: NAD(P)H-dependent oxidoreductase [Spirochaetaceae bacterium]